MSALTYHLERENLNQKNYLVIRLDGSKPFANKEALLSLAAAANEKVALEFLLKQHLSVAPKASLNRLYISPERSFEALKLLGVTGKLFYQSKKIVVDPFTSYAFYFEAERQSSDSALVTGYWKTGTQSGFIHACEELFLANPAWVIHQGIVRRIDEDIALKWIRLCASAPQLLNGLALAEFLQEIQGEVSLVWKGELSLASVDPMPQLKLCDRHGGFADLWFDYGHYGTVAFHDLPLASWRNQESEKDWERDLLETDFISKIVESSHYYCPLDKVAKSLTFLLEVGWTILDAQGRKVLRQKQADFDAEISEEKITVRAAVHYDTHQVDLQNLVGAFNRRENFIELSADRVALLDRERFESEWGDLAEQEVTSEGICIKKNRFGLLKAFLEEQKLPGREDLRQQIEKMAHCQPLEAVAPSERFRGTLFPYQREGLQWLQFLREGKFGGLLADEMGLGKTVQVLAFFSLCTISAPCLIVVPTSLLFNWQREMEKFLPDLPVYRHEGKDRLRTQEELSQQQVILVSYALLRQDADIFHGLDYQVIVLDEGQAIKNPDSQIAKICSRLNAQMRLVITGTPIENRLDDLWSLFHFLLPDLLGERRQFQAEMQAAQADRRYLERVKKKLKPFILRRKKEQVALQLPPKLEQTVFVEMNESQREIYERWLQNTRRGLLKKVSLDGAAAHRMEILEAILRLRQLCAHPWLVEERQEEDPAELCPKFERLLTDVQEVVEENRKVLIYSQFTQMLRLIEQSVKQKGWKYVYLDGSTANREQAVKQFQEDPETSLFLISLKAGGVGLNLTAADYVFLYDPWWNEAAERQAIDRAHRLGRKETVIARRYITALSIEEKVMHLKSYKAALSEQLLDSASDLEAVSLEDLLDLLA